LNSPASQHINASLEMQTMPEQPQTSSSWLKPKQSTFHTIKVILFSSYANFLLVFVPVGISMHFVNVSSTIIFVMNFLAIIPLAGLLCFATEEISMHVGQTLAGLMNASFGNAVELIVGIIALVQNQIDLVQASLIGSMLSNLLLVLGMAFFLGGIKFKEQKFNMTMAQTASGLLVTSVSILIIPAVFHAVVVSPTDQVLSISRGASVILLLIYGLYLYFQLKTHTYLFDEEQSVDAQNDAQINAVAAMILLVIATALVGVCAEFLVSSIDDLVESSGISLAFVGLILLPIVGNAAEHVTACTVAYKGKMDLAIGVAVGSSIQIALLVTPFMVILGWILNKEMSLYFNIFQTTALFLSVLIVAFLMNDARSNYLEGTMLFGTYVIIAVAIWFYPSV